MTARSDYIATIRQGRVMLDMHPDYVARLLTEGPPPEFWQLLAMLCGQARIQADEQETAA